MSDQAESQETHNYNAVNRTHWTDSIVGELTTAFQDGLNVTQACWQAGISRDFYYERVNKDPAFADKMTRARDFASMNARKVIVTAIKNKDQNAAKWWLERRNKDEFSTRQEVTGRGGKALVQSIGPEEQAKIDNALKAKAERETPPNEANQPTDSGVGGAESQSVS